MNSMQLTRRNILYMGCCSFVSSHTVQAQNILSGSTIWVWQDCILTETKLKEFTNTYNIRTLFIFVTPASAKALLNRTDQALARIKALRSGNRKIYAVCGESEWSWGSTVLPEHAQSIIDLVKSSTLFDGLHFDVEPQALADWNNPQLRKKLIQGTINFYKLIRHHTSDIAIDIAVNPIFNSLEVNSSNFLKEISCSANSLSIMSYRNNVDKAINWARPSIIEIENLSREWRMGVLVSDGEPGTSWKNTPKKYFSQSMEELDKKLFEEFGSRFYRGIAYHDYNAILPTFVN